VREPRLLQPALGVEGIGRAASDLAPKKGKRRFPYRREWGSGGKQGKEKGGGALKGRNEPQHGGGSISAGKGEASLLQLLIIFRETPSSHSIGTKRGP